jgi:hypothetical protein
VTSASSSFSSLSSKTVGWPMLLLVATGSAALNCKTGSEGPASYMGYLLSCAPDSERRKPCRQGPPLIQPDGAVVKATNEGGCDNENVDGGNLLVCQILSPLSPFKKVGFRFRSAGVFSLAFWGPLGLWCLWFPCCGSTGGRCNSPTYPGPGLH